MSTLYFFKKAVKISQKFNQDNKIALSNFCKNIQTAQKELLVAAEKSMSRCMDICKGMCCKNIYIDSIFSVWDFVFILNILPHMQDEIKKRLESQLFLYSADCPFLRDKHGPCLFPPSVKGQVCIVTFCGNDEYLKKPIKKVNHLFFRLSFLVWSWRIKNYLKILCPFSDNKHS